MLKLSKMNYRKSLATTVLTASYFAGFAQKITAATNPPSAQPNACVYPQGKCYDFQEPNLGCYLECAVPKLWTGFITLVVAITIIFVMILAFQTVINRENDKFLQEMPKRWLYIILLALFAVGGGSAFISWMFGILKIGTINDWLAGVTSLFYMFRK